MKNDFMLIGYNGFVGSAFYRYFRDKDKSVIKIGRTNYEDCIGKGSDVLINANGNSKKYIAEEDPKSDFNMNVDSTLNTLFDFNYDIYVFLSSIDVYNDHTNPDNNFEDIQINPATLSNYGFDKYVAELCVKKYARNWLILRLGGMIGEGLKKNSIYDLINGDKLWVHPDSEYQFISTEEVVNIAIELLNSNYKNTTFNICGNNTISIRDIGQNMMNKELEYYSIEETKEVYRVNNNKINNIYPIKESKFYVQEFIDFVNKKGGIEN